MIIAHNVIPLHTEKPPCVYGGWWGDSFCVRGNYLHPSKSIIKVSNADILTWKAAPEEAALWKGGRRSKKLTLGAQAEVQRSAAMRGIKVVMKNNITCNHAGRECAAQWVQQLYGAHSCALACDMVALHVTGSNSWKVMGYNEEQIWLL